MGRDALLRNAPHHEELGRRLVREDRFDQRLDDLFGKQRVLVGSSVLLLSLLQPLHGLTFALLHLACMRVLGIAVPAGVAATAQTLYAFGAGLVTAVLTSLSGTLYVRYGGVAFLSMATLCLIALPFAWYGLPNRADQRRMLVSP